MNIGNVEIGSDHTFIIAECCSNITQHLNYLEGVVDAVKGTGADALKVQLFKAEHFPAREQDAKRRVEFPRELFPALVSLCRERGLAVGASVFDEDAIRLVVESGGDFLKLATREWGNRQLEEACDESGLPTIQSVEFEKYPRYAAAHFGYMCCVPEYPAINVRVPNPSSGIHAWSSHTRHWLDVLIAVTRGADIVEKHIAFGKNDYESGWSLYPQEFAQMVNDIRWVERAR